MSNIDTWVSRVSGDVDRIYNTLLHATTPGPLIKALFQGNQAESREAPQTMLPEGYGYTTYAAEKSRDDRHEGLTVAYHAHPSDISSDFASYVILNANGSGKNFRQVILTRGEAATLKTPLPVEELIAIRKQEEERASSIMGIKPEYLKASDGSAFPDGRLLDHLADVKLRIKQDIYEKNPKRILLPSPWPDHADHVAIYVAAMNAITELKREHYFDTHGKIEILSCEPEFGVAIGQPKAVPKIPDIYGGGKKTDETLASDALAHFSYKYHLDKKTGIVHAAANIAGDADGEVSDIARFPLAVPPVIIAVKGGMTRQKIASLLQHETQVNDKNYGHLIPTLDRLRGMAIGQDWGVGVYPIQIPGVTVAGSPFIDSLEPGTVFQLMKGSHADTAMTHTEAHANRIGRSDFIGAGAGI